jgi:methyl coenzyme M reductase alpha subunit
MFPENEKKTVVLRAHEKMMSVTRQPTILGILSKGKEPTRWPVMAMSYPFCTSLEFIDGSSKGKYPLVN